MTILLLGKCGKFRALLCLKFVPLRMRKRSSCCRLEKWGRCFPPAPAVLVVSLALQQLFERRQARRFDRQLGLYLQLLGLRLPLSVPGHIVRVVDWLGTLELVFRHESILSARALSEGQTNKTGRAEGRADAERRRRRWRRAEMDQGKIWAVRRLTAAARAIMTGRSPMRGCQDKSEASGVRFQIISGQGLQSALR